VISLFVTALTTMLLALSLAGVVAGTIKAGDGMSRHSRAPLQAEEAFHDNRADMEAIQKDHIRGMCDAVAGTAEAAINAQTIASPDVAMNPIGMGFTDGMSIAQQVIGLTSGDDAGAAETPADAAENAGVENEAGSSSGAGQSGGQTTNQPSSGVAPAQAPKTYYVAWYCKDFGYEPIRISTVEVLRANELAADYPEGGNDRSVPLVKVPLTGAFAKQEQAVDAVFGMMSNPRYLSGIYAGMPVAEIGGKVHNLESCGGLGWFEQHGKMP